MSLAALFRTYVALLALLGIELGASFLKLGPSLRPLILVPALLMVAVMAMRLMELKREGAAVLLFASAGVFWLVILLGLGFVDPLTRAMYPVPSFDQDCRSGAEDGSPPRSVTQCATTG